METKKEKNIIRKKEYKEKRNKGREEVNDKWMERKKEKGRREWRRENGEIVGEEGKRTGIKKMGGRRKDNYVKREREGMGRGR